MFQNLAESKAQKAVSPPNNKLKVQRVVAVCSLKHAFIVLQFKSFQSFIQLLTMQTF